MSKRDQERAAAIEAGRKVYQGRPCSRGHDGRRYTSNRACVACTSEDLKTRRAAAPVVPAEQADDFGDLFG